MQSCEKCVKTGHRWDPKKGWVRCECLEQDRIDDRLGAFATDEVVEDTTLDDHREENLVIEGSVARLRPHIARVLLNLEAEGRDWEVVTSQRLAEIWLRDEEVRTTAYLAPPDLVILLLGIGELKNKELPSLILELLQRRELAQKPTWAIFSFPVEQLSSRYNAEVKAAFGTFTRIRP